MATFDKPTEIDDLTLAFPANALELMPLMEDIPEEFKLFGALQGTKWNRLVGDWFFKGLKSFTFTPKEGIDQAQALRHVQAILGSYAPKHEHKEAAVAYLLSLWFEDAEWEPGS